MAIEIRPCATKDELEQHLDISKYVFAATSDEAEKQVTELRESFDPAWTLCAFEDGKAVAATGAFPFQVRLNGASVPMAGITGVGSMPGQRGKGLIRQLLTRQLSDARDACQPFAILIATFAAMYQRLGYGLATTRVLCEPDPARLQFLPSKPDGGSIAVVSWKEIEAEAKRIFDAYVALRNLMVERDAHLWRMGRYDEAPGGDPFVMVHRDASGEADGYVSYYLAESADDGLRWQSMNVRDLFALNPTAHRALWQAIASHDLVGKVTLKGVMAVDDPVKLMLGDPRALNWRQYDGLWMRVSDVEAGLEARPYGADGELVIEVVGDDVCPWNEGRWRMTVDGGRTSVSKTDRARDLSIGPGALATLIAGHSSATTLARAGRIDGDDRALALADAVFATEYAPYCPDEF